MTTYLLLLLLLVALLGFFAPCYSGGQNRLQLWIDEEQVSDSFPEWRSEIAIIKDGAVNSYLRNPELEKYMPILPANLETVNLKWKAGDVRYHYKFDELTSLNLSLLYNPLLSITEHGEIPSRQTEFQVAIPCTGHKDGVAHLSLGLQVFDQHGKAIEGSPIKFRLRKQCKANALCYPKCENNGTCISPEKCACPEGYYGKHCEKALCKERCQNGGRCVKRGHCWCAPDYYGEACQYHRSFREIQSDEHCSKSPCKNGGTCVGSNMCRCPAGFSGALCEIAKTDADRTRRSHKQKKWKRKKRPNKKRKRRKRKRAKKRNKKKRRNRKRTKRRKKKKKNRRKPV